MEVLVQAAENCQPLYMPPHIFHWFQNNKNAILYFIEP